VRAWPRMTREQLVKLFPDGRTVHLPSNGGPLPGYELAKADLERGQRTVAEPQKKSLLARLFGRGDKDAEEADDTATARESVTAGRWAAAKVDIAKADTNKVEPSKLIPARVQLASAGEPPAPAAALIPMPPRRPVFQLAAATESKPAPTAVAAPAQPQPFQVASLSPNAIVNMRGMWDAEIAAAPAPSSKLAVAETNALSVPVTRGLSTAREAPAGRDTTASIGPFPTDRVPSDTALAYAAAQAESRRNATVQASAAVTSKGTTSTASKAADGLDDPWTRGVVLAQSLQNSLVVTQVGDTDFASFTQFMRKPASAIMMTFSSEPYAGINADQFSGAAVVFPTTVTFGTSRRTASLQ